MFIRKTKLRILNVPDLISPAMPQPWKITGEGKNVTVNKRARELFFFMVTWRLLQDKTQDLFPGHWLPESH